MELVLLQGLIFILFQNTILLPDYISALIISWYWDICNLPFCSTRVSNELGAENPQAAQLAASVVMVLAVTEAVIVGTILFCCRYVLAYAFNSDKDVVNYVSELVPLLSFSIIMDSLQSVLSGELFPSGFICTHLKKYQRIILGCRSTRTYLH